jgi:membrane-bound lytic murein transglycosylase D
MKFFSAFATLVRLQSLQIDAREESFDRNEELPAAEFEAPLPPAQPRRVARFHGKTLKRVIVLNEPVRAAIADWLTWMRPQLVESWVNYQYLRHLMWPKYQEAELPEALLFGMLAKESAGRVHSYSRAGAAGPLQFMPDTARRYGLLLDPKFDFRLDPEQSTRANVAYLLDELTHHKQRLEFALAAYNGGEGRMRRLVKKYPNKDFWSDSIYLSLPSETQDYVPKVLAAAYLFEHPEEFNLQFPSITSKVSELILDQKMSLSELSMCLGQEGRTEGWFRTLRNLNPRLKPEQELPMGSALWVPELVLGVYAQSCKQKKLMQRIASVQTARFPKGPRLIAYTVQRGDTLSRIAKRSGCGNVKMLANINDIPAPRYPIKPGQLIRLPSCS